jgi:hypothetical protein
MDPMNVILSALALAGTALQPLGDDMMKDGYAALKALLVRKFGGEEPKLESALDEYARQPEALKPSTAPRLRELGVDRDQEVVDLATRVLAQAEAARPGITGGLVGQINAAGGKVVVANTVDTINM